MTTPPPSVGDIYRYLCYDENMGIGVAEYLLIVNIKEGRWTDLECVCFGLDNGCDVWEDPHFLRDPAIYERVA